MTISAPSDTTAPNVTINSPASGASLTSSDLPLNFTLTAVDETMMSSCWYSLNAGAINVTMFNSTASVWNATNGSIADGSYTMNAYCNDTTNNINNSQSSAFTFENTQLSACGTLDSAGTTYTLTQSITTTGTCFTIGASNVTLDGQGFYIDGDDSGYGVQASGYLNVTVKNLNATDFTSGIYFE